MIGRRSWVFLIILAGILIAAGREFLFLNLNYQLDFVANNRAQNYAHSMFQGWVSGWSWSQLEYLKWILAFLFASVMCLLSIGIANVLFGDHRYTLLLIIGYMALGILAASFHVLSKHSAPLEGVSVKLLHLTQYPVVLLFLWAAAGIRGRT